MRVKYNKLFPYPILCEERDDYKNNIFNVDVKPEKDINRILLGWKVNINNTKIKSMIESNEVDIVFHVECAKNLFRKIYKCNTFEGEIYIDNKDLNGSLDICVLIIALKDIPHYKNDNFNNDYGDISFNLMKGNIMGFYNVPRIYITKDTEELAKMSSIFSIIRNDASDTTMKIELTEKKIQILLCKEDYDMYKMISKTGKFELQPVIHSMIIMPALIYTFNMIENNNEEYENCRWFTALDKVLKNSNIILNKESIQRKGSFQFAQKLLNMPVNGALKNLCKMEE